MTTLSGDVAGGGTLIIDAEQLVGAAGALDALVARFKRELAFEPDAALSTGHPDVTAAAATFTLAWSNGLAHLLQQQSARATALHHTVDAVLGCDADVAYRLRNSRS